ncbi:STAS domain-containing protein [Streptomyces zaomyceticus]|uniref:STAS domain-containing protein n=1 Tax=Streptomyces zaomyceticus TaxID=68286 RepID=UPI0034341162
MSELSFQQLAGPPGTRVLVVAGEADIDTEPALTCALTAALSSSPAPEILVIDCSGLRFCACAGLNALLHARHAAARDGIRFTLAALPPQLARLLDLTSTRDVFEVLPTPPQPVPTAKPAPAQAQPPTTLPSPSTAPTSTGIGAQAAAWAAQAERYISTDWWDLSTAATALARATATQLSGIVGPADAQQALPGIERLERLREALALLTIGTAHTHGQLAWFLSSATITLTPVLRWRALTADPQQAFGTVLPTPEEFTDAENAVRHLQTALAHIATHSSATDRTLLQPVKRDAT